MKDNHHKPFVKKIGENVFQIHTTHQSSKNILKSNTSKRVLKKDFLKKEESQKMMVKKYQPVNFKTHQMKNHSGVKELDDIKKNLNHLKNIQSHFRFMLQELDSLLPHSQMKRVSLESEE